MIIKKHFISLLLGSDPEARKLGVFNGAAWDDSFLGCCGIGSDPEARKLASYNGAAWDDSFLGCCGNSRKLGTDWNGAILNGAILNGAYNRNCHLRHLASYNGMHNGIIINGALGVCNGINLAMLPSESEKTWLDSDLLGPEGVGDLTNLPNVKSIDGSDCEKHKTCYLDNRHIQNQIKNMICDSSPIDINSKAKEIGIEATAGGLFRYYLDNLLYLAWPDNAQLWICCSDDTSDVDAAECQGDKYVFPSDPGTLAIAPHFLTDLFGTGQQEALTAAYVAKINTHGKRLLMDLGGRFDLGAAGTKIINRENPDEYYHELGQSWGNMFLDCAGEDAEDRLCEASLEYDQAVGRDEKYHHLPMFSCNGESLYPTKISGKSCYSKDMKTNAADGCGEVAAVGTCESTCVGGYCGVNIPPVEGRGTTNVLYVYMDDHPSQESSNTQVTRSASFIVLLSLTIILGVALFIIVAFTISNKKKHNKKQLAPKEDDLDTVDLEVITETDE